MKEIIITKGSVAYTTQTSFDDIASVADGAIGFFDESGNLIASGTPLFGQYNKVIPVIGRAAVGNVALKGVVKQVIDIPSLVATYSAYVAPVKKIMVLGYATAAEAGSTAGGYHAPVTTVTSAEVGKVVSVEIVNKNKAMEDQTRYSFYEELVLSSDVGNNIGTVVNRLITKINADANRIVDAVAVANPNTGTKFTAVTAGVDYAAIGGGLLIDATQIEYYSATQILIDNVVSTNTPGTIVANNNGVGTPAQVAAMELDCTTEEGNENSLYLQQYMYKYPSAVVAGATYDLFHLSWKTPDTGNVVVHSNNLTQELIIAVPASDANVAILKTMLGL